MEAPDDWPFEDPPNVAAIATRAVMEGEEWIALVTHDDDDGSWQFHGQSREPDVDDARVVALHRVLALDPSVRELADLDYGWRAWRTAPDAPWQRAPQS